MRWIAFVLLKGAHLVPRSWLRMGLLGAWCISHISLLQEALRGIEMKAPEIASKHLGPQARNSCCLQDANGHQLYRELLNQITASG